MKSNLNNMYFLLGLIIFSFFFTTNIKAVNFDNAINVDILPTCDTTNVNNIYLLSSDNHYHKCNVIPGEFRNILPGDVISTNQTIYFNFPNTIEFINVLKTRNSSYIRFNLSCLPYGGESLKIYSTYTSKSITLRCEGSHSATCSAFGGTYSKFIDFYKYDSNDIVTLNLTEYIFPATCTVDSIDGTMSAYHYTFISYDDSYSYEDLGEYIEHIYYLHIDKDFYIFYDFESISEFDIFNNYDFTTFTDFQKLVITIGVNTFYLGFIGLCIYILIKLVYKLISWII